MNVGIARFPVNVRALRKNATTCALHQALLPYGAARRGNIMLAEGRQKGAVAPTHHITAAEGDAEICLYSLLRENRRGRLAA